MIEFNHVNFAYDADHPVLQDICLTIRDGESVGIIGANGTGKSTMMKLLLGLMPYEGSITVDGLTVEKKNFPQIRRKLGYVLQDSDNQMFMPTVFEDMIFAPRNYGLSRQEAEEKVDAVLEKLHLTELKHRYNHKISGGEKRMAAIATVLTMEPEVIIMDEPSIALDPYNRRAVINAVKEMPMTRIIVSHDLDLVLETCKRVVLMSHGQIVADGDADTILRDRKLLEDNRMELPFCLQKI